MAATYQEPLSVSRQELKEDVIRSLLAVELDAANRDPPIVIGLTGMGGIGKTFLARQVYNALAVKVIGEFLESKDVEAWKKVSKELNGADDFGPLLPPKLVYDDFPSNLNPCFAYCAKFPPAYEFSKESLVLSWIQGGLIQSQENKTVEQVASEYFDHLVSISFFKQSSTNESYFCMYDIVRELAVYVSKEFIEASRGTPASFQWGIILVNFCLEILSVIFDQIASPKKPHYALIALIIAFAAMFICMAELANKGRKQNITLKRQGFRYSIHIPSSSANPYTCIDAFTMLSAILQLIFSGISYCYLHRGAQNPMKVSFASIIFIACMASSKYFKAPSGGRNLPIRTNGEGRLNI